ncbi:unnamed protein product [Sphagnum jensenii]|uniref:Uncharacterized protein n=1 Tax=Sphagnum jensenii TaxID=128206 RepID=A0ABP1APS6_9BRYO
MWSLSFVAVLLLQCLLHCLGAAAAGGVSTQFLPGPPIGNTLSMTCTTRNGHKVYKCLEGKWAYQGGESQMVDARTHSNYVGVYRETLTPAKKTRSGWWEFLNDDGDSAESGYQYSTVTGMVIETVATKGATSFIYVATQHGNLGATSLISYIAILNGTGGNAPPQSLCKEDEVVEIPFTADFGFYTQDSLPPAALLPHSMSAPLKNQQPLESFYAQGALRYKWTGKTWTPEGVSAKLYTVPGGPVVGQFSVLAKPDKLGGRLNWVLFNPNGFSITGRASTAPVEVSKNSLGWQVIKVTSTSGSALVGPYTYVLMTSTMGGLAPSIKPTTENNSGLVITSSFSCIFWIYTT